MIRIQSDLRYDFQNNSHELYVLNSLSSCPSKPKKKGNNDNKSISGPFQVKKKRRERLPKWATKFKDR